MGKASSSTAKGKRKCWRTVTRKGVTYLLSPDGRKYLGTPAEVREAALMPWRRDALAQSLKLQRYLLLRGTIDGQEFREVCRALRREAINYGSFDAVHGHAVTIPAEVYVCLVAGARLVKDTFDEYLADLWDSEISALLDVAQSDLGKREIPFTRHELAALRRLGAVPPSPATSVPGVGNPAPVAESLKLPHCSHAADVV